MGKRENPVKELREKQIKDAALKLFSDKGFHDTTITRIAEAAGLGKGTIYWYWKSKEELAFSLVEDMLSAFLDLIEKSREGEGDFLTKLEKLVQDVANLYVEEKEHCRLLWKFRADRHYIFEPAYTHAVTDYYDRMRRALAGLIRQGIDGGEIMEVDPRFMSFMLLGIVEGLEIEWLENEEEFDLREGLEMAYTVFIKNLGK